MLRVLVGLVNRRSCFDERRDDLHVCVLGGDEERREAVVPGLPNRHVIDTSFASI